MRSLFCVVVACFVLAGCSEAPDSDAPAFSKVEGWGALPDGLVLGTVSGVAVDAQDNIWVLHRPHTVPADGPGTSVPSVVRFDTAGTMLDAWGGADSDYAWPQNEHGIHVDGDGFVWISGNYCAEPNTDGTSPPNDDHILKLTAAGDLVMQIGRPGASTGNADTENFHRAAAMQVHAATGELLVADGYGNHRVIVFEADTGAYRRMWGAFGNVPRDDHRCDPRFLGPDAPPWDEDQFSIVHGLAVSSDGFVYVADREHGRVQVFSLDGEYQDQIDLGAGSDPMTAAFSPDDEQRLLYVWGAGQVNVFQRNTLASVTQIATAPGSDGPGHMMAVDSSGSIYLARLTGGIEKLELTN